MGDRLINKSHPPPNRSLKRDGGVGDKSYAKNSLIQRKAMSKAWPIIKEAIEDYLCTENTPITTLSIADLGCSSGPNTLSILSDLIKQFHKIIQLHHNKPIQYQIFFNDLPSNDFNFLFRSLSKFLEDLKNQIGTDFGTCFFNGVPGSFYGRLFPNKSLHFVHSSYTLHWLSKVPEGMEMVNKGNIFINRTSPKNVIEGYYKQFQKDFSLFLKCRGEEIVSGGRMVVTILGRTDESPPNDDFCYTLTLLNLAINNMVKEGMIREEKVDRFNVPNFMPSSEEVKTEVLKEGSFIVNRVEVARIDWNSYNDEFNQSNVFVDSSYCYAKCIRSVFEPLMIPHFGEAIVEELFHKFGKIVKDEMSKKQCEETNITISLTKK
uniref:Salicylate carboxymethyltransferase-like n=1 Tax=Cucumis melo TaxID=3656 RepID=A0A9I9CSZ4_CUCME